MVLVRIAIILLALSVTVAGNAQTVSVHTDTVLWTAIDTGFFVGKRITIYNNTPVDRTIHTYHQPHQFTVTYNDRDTAMQHEYVTLSSFSKSSVYSFVLRKNNYLTIFPKQEATSGLFFFADPLDVPAFTHDIEVGIISSYMEVAFCGMVLMMTMYILGKFVQLRSQVYLFYALYLLFTLLFLLVVLLYTTETFQKMPLMRGFMHHFAQSASHACYFQFVRYFIQTRVHQPFFDRLLNWATIFSLGYILVDGMAMLWLPSYYPYQIVWDGAQVFYLVFGVTSLLVWMRRSPNALKNYLIIGTAALLVCGLVGFVFLLMPRLIESFPLPLNIQIFYYRVGILIEIVAFALGLGYMQQLDEINRAQAEVRLEQETQRVSNLQEVDRLKSRFLAGISHEFRTPLTLILAQAQNYLHTTDVWQTVFRSIHTNGRVLLDLVTQILDLSRIDAGKLQLHKEATDPTQCIRNSLQMFHSFAEQKQIILETTLNANELVMVDGSVLEKVINNLISNAIKYTPAGGEVHIGCELVAQHLSISVKDNGIGVSLEELPKIFDRFYRASEQGEGTGIGLALTKELVELHGGRISVTSQLGTGTCLEVFIPVERAAASLQSVHLHMKEAELTEEIKEPKNFASVLEMTEQSSGHDTLMLIVEDHDELRNYLAVSFKKEYNVITASNGAEGFDRAVAMVPDIIITDWMMPRMSGAELCHQVKSTAATSHIPVIILTAKADTEARVEGLTTGADDYVTKPFEWIELQARVSNLVKWRKILQEKFSKESNWKRKQEGLPPNDKKFIDTLHGLFEQRLDDSDLSVELLAHEIGMSRAQLFRKTKSITGHSVSDLLRDYRLTKAAELIRQEAGNISEIAYRVGFENLSYFTKAFRQKYQQTPSQYKQSL